MATYIHTKSTCLNKLGKWLAHEFGCFLFFCFVLETHFKSLGNVRRIMKEPHCEKKHLLLQLNLRKSWSARTMQSESIKSTCMHLVYFVKMYCKWKMHEDCSDLQALNMSLDFADTLQNRLQETFELNQLKSVPSQLLPVFSGFDWLQTCCY